jgi:hypothetical protein
MQQRSLIRIAVALCLVTFVLGACKRQATAPELQTTTGQQPRMQPMTVTGCLKSGVADDTFVLMASKTEGAIETATFQLNARPEVDLKQYIGQTVEVSGTLRTEQEVASTGQPTELKPAKGTSGTPTVETKSEIDVKRLDVNTVTPTGNRCDK